MAECSMLEYFEKIKKASPPEGRKILAILRRGINKRKGTVEMMPYVAPFITYEENQQWVYFLIASLYGYHDVMPGKRCNFGETMWALSSNGNQNSTERRFITLLSSDNHNISSRLFQAVQMAKSKNIPVDYNSLFFDLLKWGTDKEKIRLEWSMSFWSKQTK